MHTHCQSSLVLTLDVYVFIAVNKAKVIKKQSVFDRLGKESPPLTVTLPEQKKKEVKTLKPLKTSVTVQLKVRTTRRKFILHALRAYVANGAASHRSRPPLGSLRDITVFAA